jgi:hypothetical protein
MTEELVVSVAFVLCLMLLGSWLETINGRNGLFDEFLTPLPLGIAGMLVLAERAFS